MNHFREIAKMIAVKTSLGKIIKDFYPDPKSMALRNITTSGWSLTEADPYNNVTRTCVEAISALGDNLTYYLRQLLPSRKCIELPEILSYLFKKKQILLKQLTHGLDLVILNN